MMEWSPEQVETVGGVFAAMIATFGLIVVGVFKFVGQRTDPMLGQLMNRQMDSQDKRDKLLDELVKSVANDRAESHKEHQGIIDALGLFKNSNDEAHNEHAKTLEAIEPAISTLTRQLIETETRVDAMNDTVGTQDDVLKQILQVVNDMKQEVTTLVDEFRLNREDNRKKEELFEGRLEMAENNIDALGDDIRKRITSSNPVVTADPAPDNQPIVRSTANPVINPTASPTVAPEIAIKTEPKTDDLNE